MGVRGRGSAECSTTEDKATLARLLDRYTAGTANSLADWLLNRNVTEALIDRCTLRLIQLNQMREDVDVMRGTIKSKAFGVMIGLVDGGILYVPYSITTR